MLRLRERRALPLLVGVVLIGLGFFGHAPLEDRGLAAEPGKADVLWIMVDVTGRGFQGDAHLIVGGQGQTVLIDGGEYVNGRDKLLPLLRRQRIQKIDAAFITHAHFDHMGGVLALLDANVPIGTIYMHQTTTPESCRKEDFRNFGCRWGEIEGIRARAGARGIALHGWSDWTETPIGKAGRLVKVVAFEHGECPIGCDLNDTSLIARLEVHGHRVLFTGDLNRPLGDWLVQHKADELDARFLKVPHHGTDGTASDEFFRAVRPRYSFVPAPTRLWCSERSARVRTQLLALSGAIFVSEAHGDVFTHFFPDGTYAINATRRPARTCP